MQIIKYNLTCSGEGRALPIPSLIGTPPIIIDGRRYAWVMAWKPKGVDMNSLGTQIGLIIGLLFLTAPSLLMAMPQVGDRQYLRAYAAVPPIPEGTLWKIVDVIQSPSGEVPGGASGASRFFEIELVAANKKEVCEKINSLTSGGYLDGSNEIFEKRIIVHESEMVVVLDQIMVALIQVTYSVGQTALASDPRELPTLPPGYVWTETSRTPGVGSLLPGSDGSVTIPPDSVTYTLEKERAELPDTFADYKTERRLGKRSIQRAVGAGEDCVLLLQDL